jgi:1-deoxyxylulose-5-phosphate synthase
MKKRRIGRTNLHVSELGLSTINFGWLTESKSLGILDAFHRDGGNFVQSIGSYPYPTKEEPSSTRPEEIVGDWLRSRSIRRDTVTLATRVKLVRPGHGGSIHFANLIRQSCESSLRRLHTDHLDLVTCEWDDALGRVDDVMEAYDQLIRAGMVRHVAAGGFPPWRVVDSLHRSTLRDRCRFEALEAEYSLASTGAAEAESLRMSHEHHIGFLARSPLASGFLTKRPVSIRELVYSERNLVHESQSVGNAILTAVARIADTRGASPSQIALAWVLHSPHVSAAMIDPDSVHVLEELTLSSSIELKHDEVAALSRVSPRKQVDFAHVHSLGSKPLEFQPAL